MNNIKKSSKIYKKNILFFLPSIEGGGVERNFYNYLKDRQMNKKFNIKILTYDENKLDIKLKNKIIKNFFYFKTNSRILKIIICFINIFFLRKKYIILSFQANIFAIIASKIKRYKTVIRLNTSPEKYVQNLFTKLFFKFFYSRANLLIVNSFEFKKKIKTFFNLDAKYVNNLVDTKSVFLKSKIFKKIDFFSNFKGIKLVSVGRLVDQKNHILSLKAINILKNKVNLKLIILGSGEEKKKLKTYIKKNNLEKNVLIKNYHLNPYNIIKQSDYFLLTSKFEGMPNILLETGILEKPIISSNCPTGPKELKKLNARSIKLFKNNNINSLVKSLSNLKRINKKNLKHFKEYVTKNYGNSNRIERILKQI
jgi:glycosyltransferase involved in cell wall biosynthesis